MSICKFRFRRKKNIIFLVAVIVCSFFVVIKPVYRGDISVRSCQLSGTFYNTYINVSDRLWCDTFKGNSVFEEFGNIRLSSSNVFFIESSCASKQIIKNFSPRSINLNERQVCSVESTARTNPDRRIFLLYTCPLQDDFMFHSPNFSKVLFDHENVQIVRVNLKKVFENTPLSQLYRRKLQFSLYPNKSLSVLLRFVVLWRYGGTFLDLDIISINSLHDLGTNYIGLDSWISTSGVVLNVEPFGSGHRFIHSVLQYVKKDFDSWKWDVGRPEALEALTKSILQQCNLQRISKKIRECHAIRVLKKQFFYPVPFKDRGILFNSLIGPDIVVEINKKHSYIVHFWNFWNRNCRDKLRNGPNQGYNLLAREFCPNVVKCGRKIEC